MRPKIQCPDCGMPFSPTDEDWTLIQNLAKADASLAMIICTECWESVDCNPVAVVQGGAFTEKAASGSERSARPEIPSPPGSEPSPTFRCPVLGCTGWVCEVEESPRKTFWGCGECGNVWRTRDKLEKAITKILKKRAYRETCYERSESGWLPADPDQEHPDYEELVEEEE